MCHILSLRWIWEHTHTHTHTHIYIYIIKRNIRAARLTRLTKKWMKRTHIHPHFNTLDTWFLNFLSFFRKKTLIKMVIHFFTWPKNVQHFLYMCLSACACLCKYARVCIVWFRFSVISTHLEQFCVYRLGNLFSLEQFCV